LRLFIPFRLSAKPKIRKLASLQTKRIYNGLALSQTVKNNASGDAVQFKAASNWPFAFPDICYLLLTISTIKTGEALD